ENKLALVNTNFSTPKRGISYFVYQVLSKVQIAGNIVYRLSCIFTRQTDRRLVLNTTVRRHPVAKPELDHNLLAADIRLLGCFAPNRCKREMKGRR
ncbi:unnamed protein product, partial [Laminaria digitata]